MRTWLSTMRRRRGGRCCCSMLAHALGGRDDRPKNRVRGTLVVVAEEGNALLPAGGLAVERRLKEADVQARTTCRDTPSPARAREFQSSGCEESSTPVPPKRTSVMPPRFLMEALNWQRA